MYNKLHNREKNVLINVFVCLPVLSLWAGDILLEKILCISLIPFKNYLLYFAVAFVPAYLLYKFLMPLHEIGHYLTAAFFKTKHHLNVEIWMDKNHTFCSCWKEYENRGAKAILFAGIFFKITYCIVMMIVIFLKFKIKMGIITFVYVIWMELAINGIPIIMDSDGYKLMHLEAFFNEKSEKRKEKEELFIRRIYPLLLVGTSVAMIGLLDKLEKFVLFCKEII